MKKIYLLAVAALFAAAPLSARVLTFYNGNEPIVSGSRIESNNFTAEDLGGIIDVAFEPELYLQSDIFTNTVQVTAKCVSGQDVQLCIGGNCEAGSEIVKNNITLRTDEKVKLEYEYFAMIPSNEAIPTVVTEISAVDTKYPDVKADFTVVMNASSGVADVFANDSEFKAVAGGIEYDFATRTEVALYNLSGEKVLETTLEGAGVLSTTPLPSGIYAYKAGAKSGKLYLR